MGFLPGKSRTFGLTELCEWSAATPPEVEYWCRKGLIEPLQDSPNRGIDRLFSLENVIEAAICRELQKANLLSPSKIKTLFARHREAVSKFPPELRASATFLQFAATLEGIARIYGQAPDDYYPQWYRDCAAFIRSWKKKQTPLDDRIFQILNARAAERDAAQQREARA